MPDAGPLVVQGALFVTAFLSATLLPGSSEALLVALILKGGFDPVLLVLIATAGNTLGSLQLGVRALADASERRALVSGLRTTLRSGPSGFQRFGLPTLLLAWVPVVGDALTLVAGLLGVRWVPFLALVGLGKLARYGVVAATTLGVLSL